MQLNLGASIGEYKIQEVIGNGGFSVVYRAQDTFLQRPVAIKQFSPEVFSEASTREWFIREARLAASLNHPNIVATYALREQNSSLFLIMEYLPGGDLHSQIMQNGPLDRITVLKVASDMCHALETLHARNVIHRDIKPENIMIAAEGNYKLGDFGLAHIRHAAGHSLNRTTGPQPGTLLYMSPEQALGEEITLRSDIYSLAVVLYEAVTARYYLPYDHSSGDEEVLLHRIAHDEPIYPDRHHHTIPEELVEPLLRALSKDPSLRPGSAREFLTEIKNAVSRAKRSTLTQKRRNFDPNQKPTVSPEMVAELYFVRTLRDREHQPEQALDKLRVIWTTFSGTPEVAAEWGETLIALGRSPEGRDYLLRAVRLKTDLPFAQLALADLYRNADENDEEADDAIIEAIHSDPDLVYAVLYDDIVQERDDPEAFQHNVSLFRRATEEDATAAIYHNLGQVLALNKERAKESIAAFEMALDLDPNYGPAYVGLGSLLIELGELSEGASTLEQATYRYFPIVAPDDWHKSHTVYQREHAFLALAVAYVHAGQYESSAIAACTVLDLNPDTLEEDAPELLNAYYEAAEEWRSTGESVRAYKFLNQIIPLAAHWAKVEIFMLLADLQREVKAADRRDGQWDDAASWLKTSVVRLQTHPKSPRPKR